MTPICVEHLKLELLEQCTKEALPELLEQLSRHNQASQYVGLCSIIGESVSCVFSNRSVDYRIDLANLLMRSIQCRSNSWGFLDIPQEYFYYNKIAVRARKLQLLCTAIREIIGDTKCC